MAISERTVQNKRNTAGELTGKSGTVYDVNIKYKANGQGKSHSKKGFPTKKAAQEYEASMRLKLTHSTYTPPTAAQCKLTVEEYMSEWIVAHGNANLRPSILAGYNSNLKNHIFPNIGSIPLRQITPAILDKLFASLSDKGLSQSSIRYVHRILSVSFEHARKYHYIESNPARDIITRFGKQGKTPDPYTIDQMKLLVSKIIGTQWELIIVLGGLYGLRLSEILGLRWRSIDLESKTFSVVEQLPYALPKGTTVIENMAPVKSCERTLPITESTIAYFERQAAMQARQKDLLYGDGVAHYIDNDLVIAKSDGLPERREHVSANFGQLLRRLEMPHIRFHDLRHSAATNMHQLTGDFYTIGQILGHSLKGIGMQLDISTNLGAVTAQYVDVRLERKNYVLNAYHNAMHRNSLS